MGKIADQGSKRKRAPTGEKPVKRRRSISEEGEEGEDPAARFKLMEQGILDSKKNYNDIAVLLKIAGDIESDETDYLMAAIALCRVFVQLLAQGSFGGRKSLSEKDMIVLGWLKDQLSGYRTILLRLLGDEENATTALTMSMELLKAEGKFLHQEKDYSFPTQFIEGIVKAVLSADHEDVRRAYIERFAEQYDDVRLYTFQSVKNLLGSFVEDNDSEGLFDRVFSLISALDGVPESAEDLDDFFTLKPLKKTHPVRSVTHHKRQAQDAWLALMKVANTKDKRKRLLDVLTTTIAPWFTKPELLADFLTDCYDSGGSTSLLALSGVFYLIRQRNLDYPSFYPKLYSLLDRDVLHSKHRSRFFRLLDIFLASTHLPAALVASFLKRLSRLALNASPSAIAFVVPWIYNMLKRHPTCSFMLHRVIQDSKRKQQIRDEGFIDPFLPEETDPIKTKAIESSLWELVQLQSHYHPNIATISKIVSEQFTKQTYNMEDFLDHSYASLLEAELGKDVKRAPVVEFQIPKRIFLPQDETTLESNSLLVKLWDFGTAA